MAIEKMLFVQASGPQDRLCDLLVRMISEDCFHLENTADILTPAEGFGSFSQQSPFDSVIRDIEQIASAAGDSLDEGSLTNVLGTDAPITPAYRKKLISCFEDSDFDNSDINVYLSGLKPQADSLLSKRGEYEEKRRLLSRRIELLSHFSDLGADIDSIDEELKRFGGESGAQVHFGCLPKSSMMKLYLLNTDETLMFKMYSSDETSNWGYYVTTDEESEKAARIMSGVFFEELEIDGSLKNIGSMLNETRRELAEIEAAQKEINDFWDSNKAQLSEDYSILLDLKKIWAMRSYAVRRDEQFYIICWIPKSKKSLARKMFSSVAGLEYAFKKPESEMTQLSIAEPFPYEECIRDIEHLAHQTATNLSQVPLQNVIGTKRDITPEYIDAFTEYITGSSGVDTRRVIPSGLRKSISEHSQERRRIKAEQTEIKKKINRWKHFKSLEVEPAELLGAKYMTAHFGRMPTAAAEKMKSQKRDVPFYFETYDSNGVNTWCVWASPDKYAQQVERLFGDSMFKDYKLTAEPGSVEQIIESLNARYDELDVQKESLGVFWNENSEVILLSYSVLLDLRSLWNERSFISLEGGKFTYSGSAPKSERVKIERLCRTFGGFGTADASHIDKSIEPPTRLKNPRLFKPFEFFVEMYGMPKYGSLDITAFVAITYTVLFGIMFGDLGQGAVLVIGGLILWLKKKSKLARAIIPCGCASMIAGLVFGSVFGYEDMLDPLYHAIGLKHKPVEVMESINGILIFAIGVGVSLVVISILVNIVSNLHSKRIGAALFDTNGLAGLLLYVFGVFAVYGFMAKQYVVPLGVSFAVMGVCAAILFLKEKLIALVDKGGEHSKQSAADFVMQNFFELIEYVLSYFSNTVSFLRVGAFVLVHAGMMMVVFSLAGDSKNIFVVILGNILIIALEGLLSGIQALRLEFYEMFSRCYTGGGKRFVSAREAVKTQGG